MIEKSEQLKISAWRRFLEKYDPTRLMVVVVEGETELVTPDVTEEIQTFEEYEN